jgi:malonyl-CoA O-methyltransferase
VPLDVPQWLAAAGVFRVVVVAALGWFWLPLLGPPGAIAARAAAVVAAAGLVAVPLVRIVGRSRSAKLIDTLSGYARWAPGYPPRAHNPLMEVEESAVRRLLPDLVGAVCLDVACGSGRYLRILDENGAERTVGIDAVPQMIASAQRLVHSPELVLGRFEELPFPPGTFDVVVCGLAVGHAEDLDTVVSEMARVLRPGGVLICTDIHPETARSGGERTFTTENGTCFRLQHHIHEMTDHRRALGHANMTIDAMVESGIESSPGRLRDEIPVILAVRATRRSA